MALTQVTSAGLKDGEIVNADLHSAASVALSKLASTGALGSAVTATTQSASDNSTKIATTAFVQAAVTSLIDGAPGSLNTLNELAAAINDDSSYATTLTTALATKAVLSGSTNNTIATVTGANALTGEASLTFDAGLLKIDDLSGTAGKGRLEFGNSGEQYIEGFDTGNGGSGSYLAIGSNTNERLRITSDGKIGINEPSPASHLVVRAATDDNPNIQIYRNSGGGDVGSITWASSQGTNARINWRGGSGNMGLSFSTSAAGNDGNAVERLRIQSGGDVIMGTIANDLASHVGSSRRLAVVDVANGALLHLRGQSPSIFLDCSSGGKGSVYLDGHDFAIFSGTPAASVSERLRITSDGIVGINKSSPNAGLKLHVGGKARFDDDLQVQTGGKINTNSSQGQLTIQGGATYPGSAIKFAGGQGGATDQGQMIFYAGTDTSLTQVGRIGNDGSTYWGPSASTEAQMQWAHDTNQRPHIFWGGPIGGAQPTDGAVVIASPQTDLCSHRVGTLLFGSATSGGTGNTGLKAGINCVTNASPGSDFNAGGNLIFQTKPNNVTISERLEITSEGRFRIKSRTNINGLQDGRIEWWNENGAGIMAMIACNRELSAAAPSGLDFFTTESVDTSANSSEGDRSRKLRIESMGRMKFDSYAASADGNTQHFMMEGKYADNSWGTVLRLHIGTANQDKPALQFSNSDGNNSWLIGQTNHSTDFRMNYGGGPGPNVWGTTRFRIDGSGNFHGSSSNDISDERLKKDIATITNASDKIKNLRGVTFKWQERAKKQEGTCYGFVAQEMDTAIPDLVCKTDGLVYFDKEGEIVDATNESIAAGATSSWDIHMSGVIPVLVESLKEALVEIDALKTKVAVLEAS